VTDFVGGSLSQVLWGIGTGSRFESIQRGVIDLRDLVYYLSLTGIFLTLNVLSVDSIRWSAGQKRYKLNIFITAGLLILNLVFVNVWLYQFQGLRLDLTSQKEYTLSQTSKNLLSNLQEPLLIRAYISDKTHPLLKPLEPQISDMLREYEIASRSMVTAEVVDPITDPDIEAEANQTYGIRPSPFQVSGKYETSVINSYFDILVRYGDQSVVLGVQDLIEVNQLNNDINVRLRNLEYDLTAAIKKVVYGFQSIDAVLSNLDQPVQLTFYISPETLPGDLLPVENTISQVVAEIQQNSPGKLEYTTVNPNTPTSSISPRMLYDQYGIQPYAVDLFAEDTFYFHLVLVNGDQAEPIYPNGDMTEGEVRTTIEAALKRTAPGFLKVIGVWTPPATPTTDIFGQMQQPISSYDLFDQQLRQDYTISQVDLSSGVVPPDIDALVIVAPENLDSKASYAIDQYLMRGGSVIIALSNYKIVPDPMSGFISLQPIETGLRELLSHYGVSVGTELVMDTSNLPFPVVVQRQVGNTIVQEIQAVDYPFFVDILPDGMDTEHPALRSQPTVTLPWTSPVQTTLDDTTNRSAQVLLYSSENSWLKLDTNIMPDFGTYPDSGFPGGFDQQQYALAVAIQGNFESYFKGKTSPLDATSTTDLAGEGGTNVGTGSQRPTIEQSAGSARLVVIGGSSFLDDFVLQIASRISQDRPLNNLQFLQNAVDWSVEDLDLLSIRARGTSTRLLQPLDTDQQTRWEAGNYVVALLFLAIIYIVWRQRRLKEAPMELLPPAETIARPGGIGTESEIKTEEEV